MLEKLKKTVGNIFAAGVRCTNEIEFGDFIILNLNTTIGHDCLIKDYASVMPGVNISGNVILEECCYIGTGASIINGNADEKLTIGKGSIIGAGSVVIKNIPPKATAVGVPAKVLVQKA